MGSIPIGENLVKIIKKKPITPGTRHLINIEKSVLLKTDKLFKTLYKYQYKNGRSSITGHITSWHRGSGCKNLYRNVESDGFNKYAINIGISYDPNRSAFISNNFDLYSKKFYNSTSVANSTAGAILKQVENLEEKNKQLYVKLNQLNLGFRKHLEKFPIGSVINSIALNKNNKIKFAKAAGSKAQLIRVDKEYISVKVSTGKLIYLPKSSVATLGTVSNRQHKLIVHGKAGRKRHLNRRPIVRGIAMNPVDHPHGGRSNGGRPSCSPWGILTKGKFKLKRRKLLIRRQKNE